MKFNQVSIKQPFWLSGFWKLAFAFMMLHCAFSLEIIIAYTSPSVSNAGSMNETSLLEITQDFDSRVEWHKCIFSNIENCIEEYPNSLVVLDLSPDQDIQYSIQQSCKSHSLVHLTYQNQLKYFDEHTFTIRASRDDELNAYLELVRYFNWTQGIVFCRRENYDLKQAMLKYSPYLTFLTIESESSVEDLINKVVFRLGATLYYIFAHSSESLKIQNSLISSKLLTTGSGIILEEESGYSSMVDGALIITEFGREFANSIEDSFKISTRNFISYILDNTLYRDPQEFVLELNSKFKTHYFQDAFSIVNIQKGKRVIIGSIRKNEIIFVNDLIFPGNSSIIPASTKKVLQLSINAGSTNPNSGPATSGLIGSRGAYIAKDRINEGNTILSNFKLEFFIFDCGATVYNSTFAYNCFHKDEDKFGLAHISSFASAMAIGAMQTFKKLNISFPIVGCTNSDVSLNSTAKYPMYTRVGVSNSYIYTKFPVLIRAMGWTKAAFLYENNSWGQSGYYYLRQAADSQGLDLINPENTRVIPPNLDREGLKNYTNVIQSIIDSQARLLITMIQCPMCNYVLEMLYDLGIRRGDIMICTTFPDFLTLIGANDTYLYKRIEIGIPMLRLAGQSWVGQIGAEAKNRLISAYQSSPNSFACFYFDGAYLIAHALDYMINRGQDYRDPNKLEAAIRVQQFSGCTGVVTIEKGSNDRIMDGLDIDINKLDSTGNATVQFIGKCRPFSTQILSISNPMIYPDGTTVKPSDLRNENGKCPFPDKQVRTFSQGRGLLFGICISVAIITLIITFVIWKKWWNITVDELVDKEEISMQDVIVGITIGIEFLQFASMGPSASSISPLWTNFSDIFSLDFGDIIKLENGVFWIVVDFVYAGIALWVILCAVILLRLDEKWPNVSMFRYLDILADYLMPILGNLGFIPFVSICLDIFLCDQSIGDKWTESFLAKDCYYFCWKNEHLVYAIISVFALLLYEPLAVFCRPLWQELQPMLHVKASPLFLMVKTVIQIALIVMNKTVKRAQDLTHGILFMIILVLYIIFIFKFKSYNYARFSWWQELSLIGVLWLALLSTIGLGTKTGQEILLITLLIGWGIIVAVGLVIQKKKYPSLLFRKKGQDTSALFKFAFSFGKSSKVSLTKVSPSLEKQSS